jgi:hypothetical protein
LAGCTIHQGHLVPGRCWRCGSRDLLLLPWEAVKPFSRKQARALPAFTPEYLHDVPGFSRRFFRGLFSRLPPDATLVLDNYQEVEAHHEFHQLVAEAVNEIPSGTTLIAVSRRDPPSAYARLIANEHVAFLEWDELSYHLAKLEEFTADLDQSFNCDLAEWLRCVIALAEGKAQAAADHGRRALAGATDRKIAWARVWFGVAYVHALLECADHHAAEDCIVELRAFIAGTFLHRMGGRCPVRWQDLRSEMGRHLQLVH